MTDYAAIMAKYPTSTPIRAIARNEGLSYTTLWRYVKMLQLRPTKRMPRKMSGSRREMLSSLLESVNLMKRQDLTGPEACGAITDIILDALDALGG